ncbi:glycosyltransferase [Chryseobacterium caseinilyticum]|uniref:Glycosyltransferase n=1 Tax=Chryseobacterium caseinilyticum TaxID=2771428 RepID=A0ABR8ZGW7_9FLAO|nr:glycosyltransferase [Chryseobacterium caseinilyticum]MBD8084329.1 glycosyltransferase [Chryseobacterium caseinilyticum]
MKKKKILIRIGSLRHGGAEKVLVTFLKNLPQDKYEIDLLLNLYSGKYLKDVPAWINIVYLNKGEMITTNRVQDIPKKAFRVVYQKLLNQFPGLLYNGKLKGKKYDIEFAAIHGMRDEILNSPLEASKKIVWIHNDLSEVKGYSEEEIRKFFGFDRIMVISEKIEQLFKDSAQNETEKNKIVKIYNPLDTEEILTKAEKNLINYKFDVKVPTFISVGTVFPQKGFDRLLKVHKKLLDEGFQHKILIVGDGYDFENIKKLKTELKVDETATLFGFTDNPYPYFKKADFYILSSRYEGFPTVLFEAITLKKKIIATDVSGVREMLRDGQFGLIVENSETGIYDGMKKAISDQNFFQPFISRLENAEMPFSLEKSVAAISAVLDEV